MIVLVMRHEPLDMTPQYREFVRGVRELHRLALNDDDESQEADEIRDAIDAPWQALSEIERKRASGLSEDLYSIGEPRTEELLEMSPQAEAELRGVVESLRRGEWDAALELLRKVDDYIAPALKSYLRGSIWQEAGDPETANLFFDYAFRFEPTGQRIMHSEVKLPLQTAS
jgi:tetratricopeptide (TPR) repeat protein